MTQRQLDRAVVQSTGEELSTVRSLGFQLLGEEMDDVDVEPAELHMNCSGCGSSIPLSSTGVMGLPEFAECEKCDAYYDYQFEDILTADPVAIAMAECTEWLCQAA